MLKFLPRHGHCNQADGIWSDLIRIVKIGQAFFRNLEVAVRFDLLYEKTVICLRIAHGIIEMVCKNLGELCPVVRDEQVILSNDRTVLEAEVGREIAP